MALAVAASSSLYSARDMRADTVDVRGVDTVTPVKAEGVTNAWAAPMVAAARTNFIVFCVGWLSFWGAEWEVGVLLILTDLGAHVGLKVTSKRG